MKLSHALTVFAALSLVPVTLAGEAGCTPQQAKDAHDAADAALNITQLACMMNGLGGFLTDSEAVAKVCNIAPKLLPVISDLIGVRDAARKSGVTWKGSGLSDAGVAPSASDAGK